MGRRRTMVAVGVLAIAMTGCSGSGSKPGRLQIDLQLDLCTAGGECIGPPASDATVLIYRDGSLWRTVQADAEGAVNVDAPPGEYAVQAKLPKLDLTTHRTGELQIFPGSEVSWSISFPLRTISKPAN